MTDINKLITDNIDVWTSAIKKRNTTGRGISKKLRLTGIEKLRELILELAVRGKLTEQLPTDGLIDELILDIEEEKKEFRLTHKNTIKVDALPENIEAREIPKGWKWVRLGSLFNSIQSGGTPSKRNEMFWGGDIPWASVKDYGDNRVILDTQDYITNEGLEAGSKLANKGDILICTRMGLGKIAIAGRDLAFNQDLKAVKLSSRVLVDFFINTYSTIKIKGTGTTVAGIKQEQLLNYLIGLPPVEEQKRIVDKVKELMALCDQLEHQTEASFDAHQLLVEELLSTLTNSENAQEFEQNWARIAEHFDLLFTTEHSIEQLKQTILQLAVMGKLVPQEPSDEPASKLLERIAQEKEQLIKDKVIKKQKPLADIAEEEKPFEVPQGWEWVRVGDLLSLKNGYAFKSKYFIEKTSEFILTTPGNFYEEGGFRHRGEKTKYYEGPIDPEYIFDSGDLIIPMTEQAAGLLGSAAFIPKDQSKYLHNQRLGKLTPYSNLTTLEFIYLFFNSSFLREELARTCTGMKVRHTSPDRILKVLIPVMSPREQVRITAKVDELLRICEQLKSSITEASSTQLFLAEAIVEKALGRSSTVKVEKKEENKDMNISTELSLGSVVYDKTAILAQLIGIDGADAKIVWSKSGLELPEFYKQLKLEISIGFVAKPAKAKFEG